MSNLRLYTFCSFYLSSIQQGIQTAHVVHELFLKYNGIAESLEITRLHRWAEDHKTIIVLNGGTNKDLKDLLDFLNSEVDNFNFPAPYVSFSEDEDSLGGILTAVGIILPEEIYNAINYRTATSQIDLPSFDVLFPYNSNEVEAFYFIKDDEIKEHFLKGTSNWNLISRLKSYSLAK